MEELVKSFYDCYYDMATSINKKSEGVVRASIEKALDALINGVESLTDKEHFMIFNTLLISKLFQRSLLKRYGFEDERINLRLGILENKSIFKKIEISR